MPGIQPRASHTQCSELHLWLWVIWNSFLACFLGFWWCEIINVFRIKWVMIILRLYFYSLCCGKMVPWSQLYIFWFFSLFSLFPFCLFSLIEKETLLLSFQFLLFRAQIFHLLWSVWKYLPVLCPLDVVGGLIQVRVPNPQQSHFPIEIGIFGLFWDSGSYFKLPFQMAWLLWMLPLPGKRGASFLPLGRKPGPTWHQPVSEDKRGSVTASSNGSSGVPPPPHQNSYDTVRR